MSMFCYQCQETAKGTGCKIKGVCGKNEKVAKLQDLLIYCVKGIAEVIVKGKLDVKALDAVNHEVLKSLFITITNANFDEAAIEKQIRKMIEIRNELKEKVNGIELSDAANFEVTDTASILEKLQRLEYLPQKMKMSGR